MKPIWEEVEKNAQGLDTEYYDADENSEILKKYRVLNVPTFIFLDKKGGEILRLEGLQNKEELLKIVKENLDK